MSGQTHILPRCLLGRLFAVALCVGMISRVEAQERVQPGVSHWDATSQLCVAVVGQVARPAVYALPAEGADIQDVMRVAGGLTGSASGQVRFVRRGRASQQVFFAPALRYVVLPGDLLLVDSKTKPRSNIMGSRTATGNRQSITSERSSPGLQVGVVNLLSRPIVFDVPETQITLKDALVRMDFPISMQAEVQVIRCGAGQQTVAVADAHRFQLTGSCVLIFDPRTVRPVAMAAYPAPLPFTPPEPAADSSPSSEATERPLRGPAASAVSDELRRRNLAQGQSPRTISVASAHDLSVSAAAQSSPLPPLSTQPGRGPGMEPNEQPDASAADDIAVVASGLNGARGIESADFPRASAPDDSPDVMPKASSEGDAPLAASAAQAPQPATPAAREGKSLWAMLVAMSVLFLATLSVLSALGRSRTDEPSNPVITDAAEPIAPPESHQPAFTSSVPEYESFAAIIRPGSLLASQAMLAAEPPLTAPRDHSVETLTALDVGARPSLTGRHPTATPVDSVDARISSEIQTTTASTTNVPPLAAGSRDVKTPAGANSPLPRQSDAHNSASPLHSERLLIDALIENRLALVEEPPLWSPEKGRVFGDAAPRLHRRHDAEPMGGPHFEPRRESRLPLAEEPARQHSSSRGEVADERLPPTGLEMDRAGGEGGVGGHRATERVNHEPGLLDRVLASVKGEKS